MVVTDKGIEKLKKKKKKKESKGTSAVWCLRQVTLTLRLFYSQWQNYLTEMLWERQK